MLTDTRKKALLDLMEWAACAGDDYYFEMEQEEFEEEMEGAEEDSFYQAFTRQREIGFEEFRQEMAEKLAVLDSGEELHFLADSYNYDDGPWVLEQIVKNPACDLVTARMVYWLSAPDYYYENFGSPKNCPEDSIHYGWASLVSLLEEKAEKGEFSTGLQLETLPEEEPNGINFDEEPFCHVPQAFR